VNQFLQYGVGALSASGVYILIGVGLTLIYGVSRLVNFAQGQFVLVGSYAAYSFSQHMPYVAAVFAATLFVGLLAVGLRITILKRRLDNSLATFLVTIGVGIVIQQTLVLIYTASQKQIQTFQGTWDLGGVLIAHGWAVFLAISAPVLVLLAVILRRSSLGRSMRAVAENPSAARLMGVNVELTANLAFFIGSALAGLAGALMASLLPFTPYSGYTLLIKGLAVALIGGLGSVPGAVIVGFVLGTLETYATGYGFTVAGYHFGAEWQDAYFFVLLIVILAIRPRGLLRGTVEA
jgi:branched-chain amino acid transport system permease protein